VRAQTHVEYLMMVGIGVLLALVAVAGLFFVVKSMGNEVGTAYQMKNLVVGGLK